jgi:Leucine-rich repeat (LRR) protein
MAAPVAPAPPGEQQQRQAQLEPLRASRAAASRMEFRASLALAALLLALAARLALLASVGPSQLAELTGSGDLRPFALTGPLALTTGAALSGDLSALQVLSVAVLETAYLSFAFASSGADVAVEAASAAEAAEQAARAAAPQVTLGCSATSASALTSVCQQVLGLSSSDLVFSRAFSWPAAGLAPNASSSGNGTTSDLLSERTRNTIMSTFNGVKNMGVLLDVSACTAAFELLTCGLSVPECAADCAPRWLCSSSLCGWFSAQCPVLALLDSLLAIPTSTFTAYMSPVSTAWFQHLLGQLKTSCDGGGDAEQGADEQGSAAMYCHDFMLPGTWQQRRASEPAGACTRASVAAAEEAVERAGLAAAAAVERRRLLVEALATPAFAALLVWLRRSVPRDLSAPDHKGCALLAVPVLVAAGQSALSIFAARAATPSVLGVGLSLLLAQTLWYQCVSALSGGRGKFRAPRAGAHMLYHLMYELRYGGSLYLPSKAAIVVVGIASQLRDLSSDVSRVSDVRIVDMLALSAATSIMVYPQMLRLAHHTLLMAWDVVACASYIAIYLAVISFRVGEGSRTLPVNAVVALSCAILTLSWPAFHVFDLHVVGGSARVSVVRNRSLSVFRSLRIRGLRAVVVAPRQSTSQILPAPGAHASAPEHASANNDDSRSGGVSGSNADTASKSKQSRARGGRRLSLMGALSVAASLSGLCLGGVYLSRSLGAAARCSDALSACLWSRVRPRITFPGGLFAAMACDVSRVSVVDARDCGLTELPSAALALSNATAFDLRGNALRDIPAWLARRACEPSVTLALDELLEVRRLDWSGGGLVCVPRAVLARAPRLEALNLSSNALSELPPGLIRSLPRLRQLDLSRNVFGELSDELLGLLLAPGRDVRVAGNPVRSVHIGPAHALPDERGLELPVELGHLSELQELIIADAPYGGAFPGWLGQLTRLRRLIVRSSNMTGTLALASLAPLTDLSMLSVSNEPQLRLELGAALPGLPALRGLFISEVGTLLSFPSSSSSSSSGGDKSLPNFAGTPGLDTITLRACGLRGVVDFDALCAQLPKISLLNLSGNGLQCALPAWLMGWATLWNLDLSSNRCSGPLPAAAPEPAPAPALRSISLNDNHFSGPLPSSWGRLRDVLILQLTHNELVGPIPDEWRSITWSSGNANISVDEAVRAG